MFIGSNFELFIIHCAFIHPIKTNIKICVLNSRTSFKNDIKFNRINLSTDTTPPHPFLENQKAALAYAPMLCKHMRLNYYYYYIIILFLILHYSYYFIILIIRLFLFLHYYYCPRERAESALRQARNNIDEATNILLQDIM